jgi:ATP-binding cassette subfamily B protein
MYNIAAGAETLGFMSRAVNADYVSAATLELPAIAHWKGYHYIVLYEIKPTYVLVGDPAIGILRLSRQDFEVGWTGRLLLLTPTSSLEDVEPEKNPLRRFLPLLKPYKFLLLEVLLASLLLELFTLAIPIFTQTIVDKVLVHNNIPMLNIMLGGMVIVSIFRAFTGVLRQYL